LEKRGGWLVPVITVGHLKKGPGRPRVGSRGGNEKNVKGNGGPAEIPKGGGG